MKTQDKNRDCRRYLKRLKRVDVKGGTLKHTLQVYVLGRDIEVPAAGPSAAPPTQQIAPQTPSGAASAGSSSEVSDDVLLAATVEVNTQFSVARPPLPAVHPADDDPGLPRTPPMSTGAQLLPEGWRQTLPEEQQDWVGQALFTRGADNQPVLTSELALWWNPSVERHIYTEPPPAHVFFQCRFFLWAPYQMWACKFTCPNCGCKLTAAGLYKTVRRVLDLDSWYFMGTEHLECGSCKRKYAAWAQDILGQVEMGNRSLFPAVLTYKWSCDEKVIGNLKYDTLSGVHHILEVQHTEEWKRRSVRYIGTLDKLQVPDAAWQQVSLPPMHPLPSVTGLISLYVRKGLNQLEETKARATSIFGDILKMDSTKKMTKLAGDAAWLTNVGNEHRQVLMSVLTDSEGDGLLPMATGLVQRYKDAGKAPPRVLYVTRDCCATVGQSKVAAMFGEWEQLIVRLDVWHFMQGFKKGFNDDNQQLCSLFMTHLSTAIFEWDSGDLSRLEEAKQSEEEGDACVQLTSKELASHCRRRTRGVLETERLIQEVLDYFWVATDSMGIPFIDHAKMEEVWSMQRRHLHCIQDPPGVELYVKTGEVTMGDVMLPVICCARGSTSLESFHRHMCRFFPCRFAHALNFQVYLLEGLVRWNENCARAALEDNPKTMLCGNSTQLQNHVNQLCQKLFGRTVIKDYIKLSEYTGELIGLEYLYSQRGALLPQDMGRDPDASNGTDSLEEDWEDERDDEQKLLDAGWCKEELHGVKLLTNFKSLLRSAPLVPRPSAVPAQPRPPLTVPLPEETSCQAATHRRPLAPNLFIIANQATAASSSSITAPAITFSPTITFAPNITIAPASAPAITSASNPASAVPRSTAW
ncbi:uncharacterized protein LOC133949157 [Platichthys flesus]|uniref:uncharacterized protein LOC133949157 n=1 Tax=Platichthys flesus TaxID=8260 RepID=UPI002DBE1960|nr:uncharacterized protein LOC133949157 [Platichthys flesus]